MAYYLDCPAITQHPIDLRFAAYPFVPVRNSLKPGTLRRSKAAHDHIVTVDNQAGGLIA